MTHTVFSSLLALVMMFPAFGKTTECGKQTLTPTQVGYIHSSVEIVNTEINKGGDDDPIVPPNYRLNL